jgi:hypothetical protein
MEIAILVWLVVFTTAWSVRTAFALTPIRGPFDFAEIFLPYALAALAPTAGYRIAMAAFPGGVLSAQPGLRLARYGRWRAIGPLNARAPPAFGPYGFMTSLLIGMLLIVAIRSFEFLIAVPAMNHHAPEWGVRIFQIMAFDVLAMNFLYAVCFVMALRSIPLFPRMLLVVWIMDIFLQFTIMTTVTTINGLPSEVTNALKELIRGNVTKILISVAVWLPYLLLSERVNVTYRCREAAA